MRTRFFALLVLFLWFSPGILAQDSKENSDFKLAVSLYNDKMYDLALEQFKQFINLFPNSAQSIEARYYLALTQFKLKKFEDARYSFQNFALSYPDNVKAPEAWMNVAEVYLAQHEVREAALAFERVRTFSPKSKQAPAALLKAAQYYQETGDRDDARRVLRVLTQEYSDPGVILPAHLRYAALLFGDKDFEGARVECKKVTDATKDATLRPQALLLSAQALNALGRTGEAETALDEIVANYSDSPEYYRGLLLLGSLRQGAGNLDEAISTWQGIVKDSAKAPRQVYQDVLMELGAANRLDRNFRSSEQYFVKAARAGGSRTGEAWYHAGESAERAGDKARMAEDYAHAVDDTTSGVDRRALLIAGMKGATFTKNYSEAVRLAGFYRSEFRDDPNLPRVLFEAASLCSDKLKDYRKAMDWYEEIIDRFPTSSYVDDAVFGLGMSLRLAGQPEQALQTFESLEKQYPASHLVERAREAARFITLFELKNKESGLEKLALLVGDVIAQHSKGDLAFRLAEIYFHELMDYRQSAVQYRFAIDAGLGPDRRADAWYNLARSYDYLSLKDRSDGDTESADTEATHAIAAYDSLLKNYPEREYADAAALARLQLRIALTTTPQGLRGLSTGPMAGAKYGGTRDQALLALGNAYSALKDPEDAALTFKAIVAQNSGGASGAEALFEYGKTLMNLADRDSAARVLNAYLEKYPNQRRTAEAAGLLADYESTMGNADRANALFDMLEKKFAYTRESIGLDGKRGDAYFVAANYAKAVDWYGRLLKQTQTDVFSDGEVAPEVLYRLGFAFEKLGSNEQAKLFYTQYVTRVAESDKLGQVFYSLATIARSENNTDLATRYLQESIKHTPASSDEASRLALEAAGLLFKNGQFVDAISRYEEVLQHTKRDSLKAYILSRIVVSYFRLDNLKEADKRAAAFVKEYPEEKSSAAEFECERGKYYLRKGDTARGLARLEQVVREYKTAPVVPEALFWTGKALELAEKPQNAISLYDSVIRRYPRSEVSTQARLSLGNVYYNLEQWDSAAYYYKALVDSSAHAPEMAQYAMNNLAVTYKQLKLYDAAMETDRQYIERYPNADDIIDKKIDVAVLYQDLGFYDQSVLQLQNLLEMGNPGIEAELRYYIGEAYFYKGNYQQAILEFLKVPYLVTKRGKVDWVSTSYYMAGQSYEKMSKFDLAVTMYKKIVESRDTDAEFKTAARREIDRVQALLGK